LAAWYLQAFGPADRGDFALWSGLPAPDVRAAFEGLDPPERLEAEVPLARLVGAYDNLLLGWQDRTFVLPTEVDDRVRHGGVLRAMLLVRGVTAGTWRLARGRVVLEPFAPLPPEVADAVEAEVADVARFLAG
jgi:hypothetical protein